MADAIKQGARHSSNDQKMLQEIHDHASKLGADCPMPDSEGKDDMQDPGEGKEPMEGKSADTVIAFGDAVKAVGDSEIEGYLVRFGDESETDISPMKDFFWDGAYYGKRMGEGAEVTFNHGIPLKSGLEWAGDKLIGEIKSVKKDNYGLLARAIIDADEEYKRMLMDMVKQGRLKWSSGALSHLVKRTAMPNGTHRIDQWIIGEGALTPTPAEPRLPAIMPIKSFSQLTYSDPEAATPEAGAKTSAVSGAAVMQSGNGTGATALNTLESDMTPEELKALMDGVAGISTAVVAQGEEIKAMKAKFDAPPDNRGGLAGSLKDQKPPAGHKTPLGDDAFKSFGWYLKTGDASGIRTGEAYEEMLQDRHSMKTTYNLLESTQYQGQEAVPTEVVARIIERRDPVSVVRKAGAEVMRVGSNAFVLPIEKASPENFVITTIDGNNTFDQTTVQPLDKLAGTIYLFTKSVPIDMQLLDDSVFGIEQWWTRRMGRAWGLTENTYFLMGTGSGQPGGAVYGSTLGVTAASATAVTASEVVDLYHKIPAEYRDNVSWIMRGATEGAVRKLAATTFFPFVGQGGSNGGVGTSGLSQGQGWLVSPAAGVFNSDGMDALSASKKPIFAGNLEAGYVIAERSGLTVFRDPYTLATKGLVNVLGYFRETGGVTNALALYNMTTPSA